MRKNRAPIGLRLARTAKAVTQAFDAAMSAGGGSLPVWTILLSLKSGRTANQSELAEAVGVQGATLTHHLNAMERDGLLTRRRDPENRRIHRVELTEDGERLFQKLRTTAVAFDKRLRSGVGDGEIDALGELLDRLRANLDDTAPADDGLRCFEEPVVPKPG